MKLTESGAITDSTGSRLRVRLISPGKGSSGYYSPEVIAESAPLFKAGTHMNLDHPTQSERFERPEGSLRDLVGVLESDGQLMPDGSVEADVKIMPTYRELIKEAAPYIGVSINGDGNITESAEHGRVIESLSAISSVDFVTKPGRGGKVLSILESARPASPVVVDEKDLPSETAGEEPDKTVTESKGKTLEIKESEYKRLVEADSLIEKLKAQIAALEEKLKEAEAKAAKTAKESAIKDQAKTIIEEAFTGIEAPRGKARLLESALATEDFNAEDFKKSVLEEAAEYAPSTGQVTGLGATNTLTESDTVDYDAQIREEMKGP